MIERVLEFSIKNRRLVLLGTAAACLWGVYCLFRTPVDAIPDLSENQVIVWADWMGRSPKEVEDQVTYPLSVKLQGLSGVRSIRASSEFGYSMVSIIFEDGVDFYEARQRVVEKLSTAAGMLPAGVVPYLAADATAIGQVYSYTVEGEGRSLDELRAIQDWYIRYQLHVPGVAEVATAGGFAREFQVDVDPARLRACNIALGQVYEAVMRSNASVGGKVIHQGGSEYLIRAAGWIRGIDDLRSVVVASRRGVPITLDQLGAVQLGPAFRRGVLEKDGSEAVGGLVFLRHGENPREVIRRVQAKIEALQSGLPAGVRIVPFYDRTGLISASIRTLTRTLIEEVAIASLAVILVLWHFRSALVICATLPISILLSFIFMYHLGIPSNIMSLSGIAISIGVLVDAGIVMTENAYNRLQERFGAQPVTGDTRPIILEACKVVGSPLFFSIIIMLLSFAPVFALGGRESKLFFPLACTKTFALAGVALLSVTLVPALLPALVRGRLRSQQEVWLVRSFAGIYRPLLEFFLKHPDAIVILTGLIIIASLPVFPRKMPWLLFLVSAPFILGITTLLLARRKALCLAVFFIAAWVGFKTLQPLGEEFMPPLDELSLLDMPVTRPSLNITQGIDDLKRRNALLREFPEVRQVVGKLGRAETPADPAPLDMVETQVNLRPRDWWPRRALEPQRIREETEGAAAALAGLGALTPPGPADREAFLREAEGDAAGRFDGILRKLCVLRIQEDAPSRALQLARSLRRAVLSFLRSRGSLIREAPEEKWEALDEALAREAAGRFDEAILHEDVRQSAEKIRQALLENGSIRNRPDPWAGSGSLLERSSERALAIIGIPASTFFEKLRADLEEQHHELMASAARRLDREILERAAGILSWCALEAAVEAARAGKRLAREPAAGELIQLRKSIEKSSGHRPALRPKLKSEIVREFEAYIQVPGWSNIWTQPIINRVEMLSTGVRTDVGVKVFGKDLDQLQGLASGIAALLKTIPGAADVSADQMVGENYLEISIDRLRAARYGLTSADIQEVIEVAVGGKEITAAVEGRERVPIRVRYARDFVADEEKVRNILIPVHEGAAAGAMRGGPSGMGHRMGGAIPGGLHAPGGAEGGQERAPKKTAGTASVPSEPGPAAGSAPQEPAPAEAADPQGGDTTRLLQVPLQAVADVRVVSGPTMIRSENGLLRTFVSLNIRGRDMVGFVEEAQRIVGAGIRMPAGCSLEWTGQFEHQARAQRSLSIVLPLVVFIIFLILYWTYRDFADALLMFLAVPGAIAGGALFQYLLPKLGFDVSGNFSVAVWVGYIACFGLATETSIVMLVYLREAIQKRGGMENIRTEEQIREAVIEGAVNRLRPKLLTEITLILALIPMLWSHGVGSEYMRPMAVPILGGILVADEVIDALIPVLFYWDRRRRLRRRLEAAPAGAPARA